MRSPADQRSGLVSRRDLLEAAPALSMPAIAIGKPGEDAALTMCQRWMDMDRTARDLTRQWQTLETYLFRNHAWPRLTEAQQRTLPEGARLFAIDDELAQIFLERQTLLPQIQATPALSPRGALEKLEVLASFLDITDSPEGYALIRSAQRDFAHFWKEAPPAPARTTRRWG